MPFHCICKTMKRTVRFPLQLHNQIDKAELELLLSSSPRCSTGAHSSCQLHLLFTPSQKIFPAPSTHSLSSFHPHAVQLSISDVIVRSGLQSEAQSFQISVKVWRRCGSGWMWDPICPSACQPHPTQGLTELTKLLCEMPLFPTDVFNGDVSCFAQWAAKLLG